MKICFANKIKSIVVTVSVGSMMQTKVEP